MEAINLTRKLALFTKQWHPHLIAEGSSLQVYLSKLQGEFHHARPRQRRRAVLCREGPYGDVL